jgi:hypothetical protein
MTAFNKNPIVEALLERTVQTSGKAPMMKKETRKPGPAQQGDIVHATTTDTQEKVLGVVARKNKAGTLSIEDVEGDFFTCYGEQGLEIFVPTRLNEFSGREASVLNRLAIKYSQNYKEATPVGS